MYDSPCNYTLDNTDKIQCSEGRDLQVRLYDAAENLLVNHTVMYEEVKCLFDTNLDLHFPSNSEDQYEYGGLEQCYTRDKSQHITDPPFSVLNECPRGKVDNSCKSDAGFSMSIRVAESD